VRHGDADAHREARERFLAPLLAHMDDAGIDHISEIADGDSPHRPDGCPFQAWSVGEALRLVRLLDK
jgi:glycogen debranching enzyme